MQSATPGWPSLKASSKLAAWAACTTLLLLPAMATAADQEVSYQDLLHTDENPAEWLSYGRNYQGHRFSPLTQITPDNVDQLRPVWAFSAGGDLGGLEATPLYHDGTLYISADFSRVFALDATNGEVKWRFEPELPDGIMSVICCGPVNRGVALHKGKVIVKTLDARLVALDAETGEKVWETRVADWKAGYGGTAAPLVVKDKIVTGVTGGEYGIRGFVAAFDAETGERVWKTHMIPGPGQPGHDSWEGDDWKTGGASTWTTGAYDPELDMVYWQTGNAAPWTCRPRPGDNKWTAATVAMDADTGERQWGYQYTPHDCWDYDATSSPVLADLEIEGKERKVLIHADKNGHVYMLDRTDGEFLHADPIVPDINWTHGLDPETGRPDVVKEMVPEAGGSTPRPVIPGLEGGIDWQPPSYNPELGYLFFPSNNWGMEWSFAPNEAVEYEKGAGYWYADFKMVYFEGEPPGHFLAYDVKDREIVWDLASPEVFWAGSMTTKSNLVFTGDFLGYFMALDARTGDQLYRFQTGSSINSSPITYEVDGTQYVAVLSGLGGDMTFYYEGPKAGTVWVFALEGEVSEPAHNLEPIKDGQYGIEVVPAEKGEPAQPKE